MNGTVYEPGTAFHIGRKSRSWYSYRASPEDKEKVISVLQGCGIHSIPEHQGNCNSRVVVTIEGQAYAVYQKGCRLMPLESAKEIAMKMGECAAVNVIGAVSPARTHPKRKPVPLPAQAVPAYKQMSLF